MPINNTTTNATNPPSTDTTLEEPKQKQKAKKELTAQDLAKEALDAIVNCFTNDVSADTLRGTIRERVQRVPDELRVDAYKILSERLSRLKLFSEAVYNEFFALTAR
jgi:hypothetical protein